MSDFPPEAKTVLYRLAIKIKPEHGDIESFSWRVAEAIAMAVGDTDATLHLDGLVTIDVAEIKKQLSTQAANDSGNPAITRSIKTGKIINITEPEN